MQIEEQLVVRKVAEYCRVRYLLMSIAMYNIIHRVVSIYIWMRRQSNQGKQGRGNDIICLVSRFDIEYCDRFHRTNERINEYKKSLRFLFI